MLWQGLGYHSRARRLHQAAQLLSSGWSQGQNHHQHQNERQNALQHGSPDWVLAPGHRWHIHLAPPRGLARFWQLSELLLDPRRPRAFNQALMDLGASVCTPRSPRCGACPWQGHCAAYAAGDPARFPVKDAVRTVPHQVIGVGVVLDGAGRVLIDQRLNEGLLGGLWEFPGGKQEEGEAIAATIGRELVEELAIEVAVGEELIVIEHAYSHKRLRFVVHLCTWLAGEPQPLASQQVRWVLPAELADYPFPAANARIIAALLERLDASALAADPEP